MNLKPFFSYFGGKWRAAPHYPKPEFDTIIEPFAGGAGYSLRYPEKQIILIEKYLEISEMWKWLIKSSYEEIIELPLFGDEQSIDELDIINQAKTLIGFCLNKGAANPSKSPSAWMRDERYKNQFWGESIRNRIASQIKYIKHWEVIYGDYTNAPNVEATWFIDPPYQEAGKFYKHNSSQIIYEDLGSWCKTRKGQVIVCENEGASWLPFEPFMTIKGNSGKNRTQISKEVIWINN